jgi:ABC-2 type transport system permease protein
MLFSTQVYVFALLSLGLLVGTKAENQMRELQMSMVFQLPSVFFSGFIFQRETMPWIFYAFGALFPSSYFIVMSNLLFSLCALRFRKKLA